MKTRWITFKLHVVGPRIIDNRIDYLPEVNSQHAEIGHEGVIDILVVGEAARQNELDDKLKVVFGQFRADSEMVLVISMGGEIIKRLNINKSSNGLIIFTPCVELVLASDVNYIFWIEFLQEYNK